MNFLELAKKRYSARSFSDKKITPELLNTILEAGRIAPSASNRQPYQIIVVESEQYLGKLKECCNSYGAPTCLIISAEMDNGWTRNYDEKNHAEIDTTIVTDHMMLQAMDVGIDSLWICHFDPIMLVDLFDISPDLVPVHILALGYSNKDPKSIDRHNKTRKSIEDKVKHM